MINREWKQVVVTAFSNVPDSYGQQHKTVSSTRNIEVVLKTVSINNVNDPRFIDVTDIALTKDTAITAGNEITIDTKKYLVLHVIPSSRLTQVLLKLCL